MICTDIIVKVCEQKKNKDLCKKRMSEYLRRIHLLFRCNVISRTERLDLIGMKLTVISRRKIMNCFIAIRNQCDMVFTPDYQSNIFALQKSWKSKEDEITSLSCPSRNIFLYISLQSFNKHLLSTYYIPDTVCSLSLFYIFWITVYTGFFFFSYFLTLKIILMAYKIILKVK